MTVQRLTLACGLALALSACVIAATPGRTPLGQTRIVTWQGQRYPLRVTRDFAQGGFWTRIVAPDAATAQAVYARVCERRPVRVDDWPEGRLYRDDATGEWAVRGECPGLLPMP